MPPKRDRNFKTLTHESTNYEGKIDSPPDDDRDPFEGSDDGDDRVLVSITRTFESEARLAVYVRRTDADRYPSGYKYRMHYGYPHEPPVVRYDNSHGDGEHHRHDGDAVEILDDFPGIGELYRRFRTEVERHERN